ncbi:hypothetical protein OROMI_032888 [Orobanche minor]
MAKVQRNIRLHYGGIFVGNSVIEGMDLYNWVGGTYVDVENACLESHTVDGIMKLFTMNCPLEESMNLRFYYMVGGNRFELDKDMEVQFAWTISSNGGVDLLRNLYCVSDLGLSSPSISVSQSRSLSKVVTHVEEAFNLEKAPPAVTTHEFNLPVLNEMELEFNEQSDTSEFGQSSQQVSFSQLHEMYNSDFEKTESDSEYDPDEDESDNSVESEELHLEDELEQAQCLPELQDFLQRTYDCTEENPCLTKDVSFQDDIDVVVGQEWKTIQDAREHVRLYGIKKKFEIKFKVNNIDKLICICKVEKCPWRCYIRRTNDGHTAICKSIIEDHTCENDGNNKNSLASSDWIANVIEDEIKRHHTSFTGKDIIKLVWHKFHVTINYWKAWFARGKALENLYGNYEESYMRIPDLCREILKSNPGSIVKWEADEVTHSFKYCCVAFKSSLEGWRKACRPLIGLDGCFLKGKYLGACLVAVGMDGNNGLFPLAFFIGRKEDGYNWNKFLEILSPEFKKHPLPLTITSDRAPSLISAIETYLGECSQRSCFRHIFKNMSKYWRGDNIRLKAYICAQSYTEVHFQNNLTKLEEAASGSSQYLMEIGQSLWCRAFFDKVCKSDHLTNNFTESFNKFIKETRDKPICSLVMEVAFLIMRVMFERKRNSDEWDDSGVVPRVQSKLVEYIAKEHDFTTDTSGNGKYSVRKFTGEHWTLDLYNQQCSCGEWQITGIPCVHGVHVIRRHRLNMVQFCNPMLTVKAYKIAYGNNINPIPHQNDWPKNRIKGHDEKNIPDFDKRGVKRCGKCAAFGHNSRTCLGGPTRNQAMAETSGARGTNRGGSVNRGPGGSTAFRPPRAQRSNSIRGGVTSGRGRYGGTTYRGRGTGNTSRGRGGVTTNGGRGRANDARGGRSQEGATASTFRPPIIIPKRIPPPKDTTAAVGTYKKRKIFFPPSVNFLP